MLQVAKKSAGQGRVRKKITGQGRIQVIKILAEQVTGYKNTLICRALMGGPDRPFARQICQCLQHKIISITQSKFLFSARFFPNVSKAIISIFIYEMI
jgi:hypothetical protein